MEEVPTYSATVWSSADDVVIKLEIRVEDLSVELDSAVELVADFHPVSRGFIGHCSISVAWYEPPRRRVC